MLFLGYDLAEKCSGLLALNAQRQIIKAAVCDRCHLPGQLAEFTDDFLSGLEGPIFLMTEDVPPNFAHTSSYKGAIHNQGRVIDAASRYEGDLRIDWIMPSTWQQRMGYVKAPGRTTKGWAKQYCIEKGFEPQLKFFHAKGLEDIRDSAIIAEYCLIAHNEGRPEWIQNSPQRSPRSGRRTRG